MRIVFGYLWPNRYYQIPQEEIARAPSRVSLAKWVTALRETTPVDPPSPTESLHEVIGLPPILSELPELPGISDYNRRVEALQQRIKAHNQHIRPLPATVDLQVEQLLACIRLGENLDKIAFMEGNITFRQLRNIDHSANPKFYTKSSQHVDNNYQPLHVEDFESQEEEGGEEEIPLPIPDPSGTHMRNPCTEHSSRELSSESTSDRLERHLGTITEETCQEWTAPEL